MKHFILISLTAIILFSCSTQKCYPSKKSKDWAVQQWIKQRSDGYYVVYTVYGFRKETATVYECMPDSIQLEELKKKNI